MHAPSATEVEGMIITDPLPAVVAADPEGKGIQDQKQNREMKATITVANKKQPKGWKEEILLPGVEDEKTGREQIDEILRKFNSDLRGDQPRKLLGVTFREMTVEECRQHGYKSHPEEDCPFSENRKERMDAWWDGWHEADREDEEFEDDKEEEEEPDEDEEDE